MSGFRHPDTTALVLAAGQGTRMNSDLAKVLHSMAGQPLLAHVLQTLDRLGVGRTLVVIGHQHERVRAAFAERELEWVLQAQQRGTGHAVLMAGPALEAFEGTLLVVCGDTPLLRASTLHELLEGHRASGAAVTVLSMRLPDPTGYGRIVRREDGTIRAIVEHRDATPEQRAIPEVNSGIYAFHYPSLVEVLSDLTAHNVQGEYYLTDTVALLQRAGKPAAVVCATDHRELLGINTVAQLEEAERLHAQLGNEPARAEHAVSARGLDRLWAPWRMAYVGAASTGAATRGERSGRARTPRPARAPACLFCAVGTLPDREALVLVRRPHALLMLNRFPYAPGHLMVAVRRHAGRFAELRPAERDGVMELTALAERALEAEYRPHGMNVGANLGEVAGAGFPGHLHLHLVPRWRGDTNFMPVIGATRVLPESLAQTWIRLRRALRGLGTDSMGAPKSRATAPAAPRSRRRG